jgi:hypothetical protein
MPDIIDLPANLWFGDRTDPQIIFNTRDGGRGLDGTQQIISPLSQYWRFRAVIPILRKDQALSIRTVKSRLQGRFNYLRARLCDQFRITRKDIGAWSPPSVIIPHSDGAPFSDYSGYALAQPRSPVMAAAAANALTVTVRASDFGGYMTAGVFFSIRYWLYQVDDWELVGDNYVLTISPPLRTEVTTDDEADFAAEALWRLDTDDSGRLDLTGGRFGFVELNLVEPVGRD